MLNVKIKKLSDKAVTPTRGTVNSAGLDITAIDVKYFVEGAVAYAEYKTGLSFEIPPGFMGLLFPRSSVSSNTSFVLSNSVGILDSDFRGEVTFRFRNVAQLGGKSYKPGDKIGQLVVVPYPDIEIEEVTELLDPKTRGTGSYGSTGK